MLYSQSSLVIYFIYSNMAYYYWLIKKDTHEQSDSQDAAQKGPKWRSFCSHRVWSAVPSQCMDELINLEALWTLLFGVSWRFHDEGGVDWITDHWWLTQPAARLPFPEVRGWDRKAQPSKHVTGSSGNPEAIQGSTKSHPFSINSSNGWKELILNNKKNPHHPHLSRVLEALVPGTWMKTKIFFLLYHNITWWQPVI